MKKRSILSAAVVFFATLTALLLLSVSASAATDSTLNLADAQKNLRGDGYEWNNPDRILTLTDLEIATADDFGLKLPDNCTVILKGNSTIKASRFGVGAQGSVVFKGDGSLTVEADEAALYNYSYSDNHKLRFGDGSITLKAGTALLADRAEVSMTGGKLTLISTEDTAADTRVLSISGGTLNASGSLMATHMISIDRASVTVNADGCALVSDNILKTENVKLSVGQSAESLSAADSYDGERSIVTTPEKKAARASIIFGEGTPITVDFALLVAAVLLVAAAVVVPMLRRRARVRRLYSELDEDVKNNVKK